MGEVLAILLLISPILFIIYFVKYRRIKRKYAPIVDVQKEIDDLTDKAERNLRARMAEAETEASALRTQAEKALADATAESEAFKSEARRIVDDAKQSARDIAGDALDARGRATEFEAAAKALQNIIKGYGDEYILPTQSILDDLADAYSFTEAGRDLKEARKKTRDMILDGQAAECDYVEVNRRRTAVAFVVDAFNGKVDSILSQTKKDNYGTLAQKIRDARALVNENGRAFRNARITTEYMNARLEELRLGCVAHELREKDRAEQRAIKEQIREEEKARREHERAIRDAAKQEETLRKAMEAAQAQVESAKAEEKAKFEARLADLQVKLAEAEARGQRAKSMAEMTKSGHVYIISNIGSFGEDVLKIGMTRRLEPLDRVRELGGASVPFPFDVHAMIYCDNAPKLESELHRKFNDSRLNKVNFRKEYFRVAMTSIKSELEALGIEASFTMRAEAMQYRETRAIEKMSNIERERLMRALLTEEEEAHEEDESAEEAVDAKTA